MNTEHRHDLWNLAPGVLAGLTRATSPVARPSWTNEYRAVAAAPDVRRIGPANAGVAVIRIDGPLVGDAAWWYEGRMALTHSAVAAAISAAAADAAVARIALELNCPGWNAAESDLTIDAITRAAAVKPVVARAYGAALSGGLWMAAMCSEISAAREALIGSVGAMVVLYDDSARFKREGIEANVFAFPSVDKAAGVPGVPLTEAAKASVQAIVDANGKRFAAAVAAGRRVSEEAVVALNAAVLTAEAAKAAGLIDVIETQEAWESRVSAAPKGGRPASPAAPATPSGPSARAKEKPVDLSTIKIEDLRQHAPALARELEETGAKAASELAAKAAAAPATLAQLKDIHRNDPAAILASQEAGHTAAQAMAARNAALTARVAELASELEAARKKTAVASGVEPVSPSAGGAAGGEHPFMAAVKAHEQAAKVSFAEAMVAVAKQNPALHTEYVKTCGARHRGTKAPCIAV